MDGAFAGVYILVDWGEVLIHGDLKYTFLV
jgi:hypothetical protein